MSSLFRRRPALPSLAESSRERESKASEGSRGLHQAESREGGFSALPLRTWAGLACVKTTSEEFVQPPLTSRFPLGGGRGPHVCSVSSSITVKSCLRTAEGMVAGEKQKRAAAVFLEFDASLRGRDKERSLHATDASRAQ